MVKSLSTYEFRRTINLSVARSSLELALYWSTCYHATTGRSLAGAALASSPENPCNTCRLRELRINDPMIPRLNRGAPHCSGNLSLSVAKKKTYFSASFIHLGSARWHCKARLPCIFFFSILWPSVDSGESTVVLKVLCGITAGLYT